MNWFRQHRNLSKVLGLIILLPIVVIAGTIARATSGLIDVIAWIIFFVAIGGILGLLNSFPLLGRKLGRRIKKPKDESS
ncbi:MAG: hypothetical protein Q8O55_04305 [Dehalococcoidales bacterium]|nr:hypothetical protein [Dehalococcoidales bacterium]